MISWMDKYFQTTFAGILFNVKVGIVYHCLPGYVVLYRLEPSLLFFRV